FVPERHRLAGAAALGVDEQVGVGRLVLPALDVGRTDPGVDVTLAEPDRELAADHLLEPEAEVHVRQEEELLLRRDRLDHGLRVPGRAAVVALGLHLRRRVHVGHDHGARVLCLPVAELLGVDRGGERAAGAEIGEEDRLLRTEDRRRLGHEVDTAKDDRLRVGRGRLARKAERVADVVRDVLHLGALVVVGEDHGVLRGCEGANFVVESGGRGDGHRTSRETWSERAEWVRAPTETKSTPVSAYARTVARETPPEASSSARPAASSTASRTSSGLMLSSRILGAPPASASRTCASVSASTSTGSPSTRPSRAASAALTPPASRRWFSFTSTPSYRPARWLRPPPQRT